MDLAARHHASHRAGLAAITAAAPRGEVVELAGGVLAAVDPDRPDRSLFNSVVYEDPEALVAAVPELARRYEAAGVRAWTVWVQPRDVAALGPPLARAGHVLDASPEQMAARIEEMALDQVPRVAVRPADPAACGALNDLAYGIEPGTLGEPLGRLDGPPFTWFGVEEDGRLVACAATVEHEGDCWITFVATHPDHRGRGLAGAVIAAGLREAAGRGCETTTLEATQLGRPAYRRIGFHELGAIEMWERRAPVPSS
ncbi:MAG TPA: GNAT family N-acetyltransferase [Baekduia sp.]|nr:GNAT family N-acetyltransferase [Baekduia sp.]